jgi:hypothetical protein
MPSWEITFLIESETDDPGDTEIKKLVDAPSKDQALDMARDKLRKENPEINPAKANAWHRERKYL